MANYAYGLPRERPTPPPPALRLGLDWLQFHTPPYAGGLADQPLYLLRQIRTALAVWQNIEAWRSAQRHLSAESFSSFCSAHPELVSFMQEIWTMQDEDYQT